MTAPQISKTAALKAARKAVGQINRRSATDYVFYARHGEEIQATSYPEALARRAEKVAYVALELMGYRDVCLRHGEMEDGTTAAALVKAGIAQAEGTA